ncbi:hypothetical protein GMOD_00010108 [Pyrenophora seminiperda CCB06]|uniref:Uncharacterized protein n=1 Tax=Pyrenophora seminiperda CCB06 TaxID=1302712 RepID=A0A3M7LZP1_9PLEO|nr:hypothetical protein GMOD_00010108 [Pyrenophora seminiperda CCB06]
MESVSCILVSSRATVAQSVLCAEPTNPFKCLQSPSSHVAVSLTCSAHTCQQSIWVNQARSI